MLLWACGLKASAKGPKPVLPPTAHPSPLRLLPPLVTSMGQETQIGLLRALIVAVDMEVLACPIPHPATQELTTLIGGEADATCGRRPLSVGSESRAVESRAMQL